MPSMFVLFQPVLLGCWCSGFVGSPTIDRKCDIKVSVKILWITRSIRVSIDVNNWLLTHIEPKQLFCCVLWMNCFHFVQNFQEPILGGLANTKNWESRYLSKVIGSFNFLSFFIESNHVF